MHDFQLDKFLEFINIDLQKAPQSELMKAATFVSETSMPPQSRTRFDIKTMPSKLRKLLAKDGELLKKTQTRLQVILTGIEQWAEKGVFWQDKKRPDKNVDIFHSLFKMEIKAEANLLAHVVPASTRNAWRRDSDERPMGPIPMRLALTFDELENAVVFQFCRALEGLDVNDLKICPVCNKWFLQQTKRLKLFCSNSCASKSGNKRRYKEKRATNAVRHRSEDAIRDTEIIKSGK